MIQDAIKEISALARAGELIKFEHEGRTYYVSRNGDLRRIKPPEFSAPSTIDFNTLAGFASYVSDIKDTPEDVFVSVLKPGLVKLYGAINPENDNSRFAYAAASLPSREFDFDRFIDLEQFIIAMQTQFVPTESAEQIIDHLGSLANENIVENKDDGFSQTIQVRSGITTKSKVKIENPIMLKPYRSFREIEQVEIPCVLRLKKSGSDLMCGLWEAGGETWKLEAISRVAEFLKANMTVPVLA